MALPPCPSCHKADLSVHGDCENCRGEWISAAHLDAAARGRLPYLRKHAGRGPPTERNCPWDKAALKAFDIPGVQYEGDLFWGKEQPRAETHCVGEGCSACGGVWLEAEQVARAGSRKAALENLARLAESLA